MIRIFLNIRWLVLILPAFLAVSVCAVPLTGFAADINSEGPALSSTADVVRAEQLAAEMAGRPVPKVIAAIRAEKSSNMALQAAIKSGNAQAIAASRNAHRAAETAAGAIIAGFYGVTPDDIGTMRGSGMGWGQIAQELGVYPGSFGLTHEKGNSSQNTSGMVPATSRDVKGGRSMMHGIPPGNFSGNRSRDMGRDHATQNYGGSGHMGGDRGDAHGDNYGGTQGSGHEGGGHSGASGSGMGGSSGGGPGGGDGGDGGC